MTDAPFEVPSDDLYAGEGAARFAEATARFVGTEVRDPDGPGFDAAFGAMHGYFGPKNEIERREILEEWLRRPLSEGSLRVTYQLLAWRDRGTGALAGVRDTFVGVDLEQGLCGVLLSHSFVPEPYRRSGVATLIRTAPAAVARREVAAAGLDPQTTPIVLCAEMEPCVPADRGSLVRLLSYGRSGYSSVPPSVVPYCQPDFRPLPLPTPPTPIPMPFVVRWLGSEGAGWLPTRLVDLLVRSFCALHLRACEPSHVLALAAADRARLATLGDRVPTNLLPTTPPEWERLIPLLRSRALPHYPEALRGLLPDPDQDLLALQIAALALR